MTVYNFDRLSVLLVEDNPYIGAVLRDVLRDLRVGEVVVLSNGAEAVQHLKGLKANALASTFGGPDVIISDFIMSPMNGLVLLRWLRTASDSPNRFCPFIMLSGAADGEHVQASRDMGADEFLVKPFSAVALYKHLLAVIDRRRPFIMTKDFFGPDRRRHHAPPPASERRVTAPTEQSVIQAGTAKHVEGAVAWRFPVGHALRDKLGGRPGAMGEIPPGIVTQAEERLSRTQPRFADWAGDYLDELADTVEAAAGETDPAQRDALFGRINVLAHELRGQGGVFGYPLVTTIGKMLYLATLEGRPEDARAIEVVKCHIDALRAVLRDGITGDGGDVGRDLLRGLKASIARHLHPG